MPITKKAIAIDEHAFLLAEELARSLKVSRSRILEMAVEEFARHRKSQQITRQINEAYTQEAENEDREIVRQMRSTYRHRAEMEW